MIRVSDITVYLKCPRKYYFISKGHELITDITPQYLERIVFKELALVYGSTFNKEDKLSILNAELDRISNEIGAIYRAELAGIDKDILINAVSAVRSHLGKICSNLSVSGDFYVDQADKSIEIEPQLYSLKFGLTGNPDKLIKSDDRYIPTIIKTGEMPENGVWKSDRIQLTAYAVLVEEQYNTVVERGFVEYARWGKVREITIKRYERRKVLQIRDKLKKIQDGYMPERPEDAPCEYCRFKGICEVKSTLVSRFF